MKKIEAFCKKRFWTIIIVEVLSAIILSLVFPKESEGADTTGTWAAGSTGRLDSIAAYSWSPAAPAAFTTDVILIYGNTSTQNATLAGNITIKSFLVGSGYTGTINLQSYSIRYIGSVTLGSASTINAGTSTFVPIGTSSTQAFQTDGKTIYDLKDSTLGSTFSTSDNLSCHTYTKVTTSTGATSFAGDSVYVSGDFSLDGASSPALTMGTSLRAGGSSSLVHFGSSLGAVTAASCNLYFLTITSGTFDDDKGISYFRKLTILPKSITTFSGSATTTYYDASPGITISDSATLTVNATTLILCEGATSRTAITQGINTTFNGSSPIVFATTNTGPFAVTGLTYSGTGRFVFRSNNSTLGVFNLSTNFNAGTARVDILQESYNAVWTFNTNGYNLSCGALNIGCGSASGTTVVNCSTSTLTSTSYNSTLSNNGTTNITFNGVHNCSGNYTLGSLHNVIGTPAIRYNGTGAATWTINGKRIYNFRNVGSATAKLTLGDSLRCAYYYDSSGKFNQNGKTIYVDSNYTNVSPDSAQMSADIKIGKNYYRGTPTLVVRTAGGLHLDTSVNYTHLFTANGNQIGPLIAMRVIFQDSAKIQKLTAPDSSIFTLKSGAGLRIDTTDSATLSGILSKLNYYNASTPGSQARLHLPSVFTWRYASVRDIAVLPTGQIVGTGMIDAGNTTGWLWPIAGRRIHGLRLNTGLMIGID